jgi:hypothetical protein
MDKNQEHIRNSQSGTGSAEQTGRDRNEQQSATDLSQQDRQNIASQIGEGENSIGSIGDMGGMSGRDDSAGGSGDRMENESTRERTDR